MLLIKQSLNTGLFPKAHPMIDSTSKNRSVINISKSGSLTLKNSIEALQTP